MSLLLDAIQQAEKKRQSDKPLAEQEQPPIALYEDLSEALKGTFQEVRPVAEAIEVAALPESTDAPIAAPVVKKDAPQKATVQQANLLFNIKTSKRMPLHSVYLGVIVTCMIVGAGACIFFWPQRQPATAIAAAIASPPASSVVPVTSASLAVQQAPAVAVNAPPVPPREESSLVAEKVYDLPVMKMPPVPLGLGTEPVSMKKKSSELSRNSSPAYESNTNSVWADEAVKEPQLNIKRTDNPGESKLTRYLKQGYAALGESKWSEATEAYQSALKEDSRNSDAWLGLGHIARAQGDLELAKQYARRAVESNPGDVSVYAMYLQSSNADPTQLEARLQELISTQPEQANWHTALGKLYADQQRWNDAQTAFFYAFSKSKTADNAYNLAISLEQINQPKVAVQIYRQALDLVRAHPNNTVSFDARLVEQRIVQLSTGIEGVVR